MCRKFVNSTRPILSKFSHERVSASLWLVLLAALGDWVVFPPA